MRRDPVTPETREAVFLRDKMCVLAIRDMAHTCFDAWGQEHDSDDLDRLTLEHVKSKLMMGRRAPSEPSSLVTLCYFRNVIRPMTKVERAWTREYLLRVEPRTETAA